MRFTFLTVAVFALLALIAITLGPIMALTMLALAVVMFWLDLPQRLWPFVGMLVALLVIGARSAMASPVGDIITAITPGLVEILGVLLTGIIAWAAAMAREKWGVDIEARHRAALQSALMSGARLALDRKLDAKAALDLILSYARASVPDAIRVLNPPAQVLEDLARAKLQEAAQVVGDDRLAEALRRALKA